MAISTTVQLENGLARRESLEAESKNPYGYKRSTEAGAASRDAVAASSVASIEMPVVSVHASFLETGKFCLVHGELRRSDRRGQAPKGAGGMPRRHQKIGRGRLR